MSASFKKLDAPSIKVVALRDCVIGNRVCEPGHVVSVHEVAGYIAVQCSQPMAELAPGESFRTPPDKLATESRYVDAMELYGDDSEFLGEFEDLYRSDKDAAAAHAAASIGVRGPAVKVTAVKDGRIGGVRVKAGKTVEVAEGDAVDAMRAGIARRSASLLTRAGVRYLDGMTAEYVPPEPGTREIPRIKLVATRDCVMIGNRVAMSGEVVEIPEDVAHVLIRQKQTMVSDLVHPGADPGGRGFHLAPGARFTMSERQLEEAAKVLNSNGGIPSVA